MIHFNLFYLAGRPTELTAQPLGFSSVFSFLSVTVLGMNFPTSGPETRAAVLMSWPSQQCIPRCWVTGYMLVKVANRRKVKIFC